MILKSSEFSPTDAQFLCDMSRFDDAQTYVLHHAGSMQEQCYAHILPLADAMEKHERYVGATVVYRALLESILACALSKYYHHGVRYLRKLDQLSKKIDRWGDVQPHEASAGEKSIRHGHPHARWHRGVLTRKTVRPCTWVPLKYLRHSEKQIEVVVQRLARAALGNNHLIWFNYS
jgi:hypothetical protein